MKNLTWKGDRFYLGLTGLPGSGKSTARSILEELGCKALDADALAHEVLNLPAIQKRLAELLGKDVIEQGKTNRGLIASRVFDNKEKLEALNGIVHPEVRKLARSRMESFPAGSIVVYDVPLLFETGLQEEMNATMVISSSFDVRLQRVQSRGWNQKELQSRENHHHPDKESLADFVIMNDGSLEDLRTRLQTALTSIEELRP